MLADNSGIVLPPPWILQSWLESGHLDIVSGSLQLSRVFYMRDFFVVFWINVY